jgi:hypothetical protein
LTGSPRQSIFVAEYRSSSRDISQLQPARGAPHADRVGKKGTIMMTKTLLTLVLVASLVVLAGHALAADDETALKDMKAKDIYKMACKPCHTEDAEAGEYTPMSLIGEQWEEFFDELIADSHKDLACPQDKDAKLLEILDKDILKKLRAFCVDHAADSEQPMTCG